METVKHDMVMTSFPSNERVDVTLSGLESRLRLAATGRESYSAVAVVVHQLFDLVGARLGIVAPATVDLASASTRAECHEMTERGVQETSELIDLAATAYHQVVTSGCADYEPLSSSLVLPVQLDGAVSFLHLVKSGIDSFAFDEFEIADRLVGVLSREVHAFARRGGSTPVAAGERSPLGAKAPDTLSEICWASDAVTQS